MEIYNIKNEYKIFYLITICWILGTIGLTFNVDVPQGSSKNLEIFKLVFLALGAYGAIAATYLNIYNSLESSKNIKDKIDFDKKENSFKFIKGWEDPSLKEARDLTRKILDEGHKISEEDLKMRIENDKDLRRSVISEFDFWEGMYLSIECKRVDENLLKKAFKDAYCRKYHRFGAWLKSVEKDYETTVGHLKKLDDLWCHDN